MGATAVAIFSARSLLRRGRTERACQSPIRMSLVCSACRWDYSGFSVIPDSLHFLKFHALYFRTHPSTSVFDHPDSRRRLTRGTKG